MFEGNSQAIHAIFSTSAEIAPGQWQIAVEEHRRTGRPLAGLLVELGLIGREALLRRVAEHLDYAYTETVAADVPERIVGLVTPTQARTYGVVPVKVEAGCIDLMAVDPFNSQVVSDLTFALGCEVRLVVADPVQIKALIHRHYGDADDNLDELLNELNETEITGDETELSVAELEALAGQSSIIRFVNLTLAQSIRAKASDIHFEPFSREFKIRYRVDGALYAMAPPARQLALPIASRLKVLANLNIAERRVPQDGRIKITLAGRAVDLRVSTLPTQFGESVVLRVLDQSAVQLDIAQLGMPTEVRIGFEEIIRRPNGIMVITGPTGSGKTTTLYSGLREINSPELKLLTAEDPVEYEIEGIMQLPVNAAIGLTFSAALRSFLRQDPDVIMVGEIRDLETAQMAIQASLTGHLVLSTLHTNDAAGAITRLIDMGIEPFLIATTLEAVLAQRLVRCVCPQCRVAYLPTASQLEQWGIAASGLVGKTFYRGRGCAHCNQSGYFGRMGVFEWLRLSEPIRELIGQKAPTLRLRQIAVAQGMRTLREDGMRAVLAGQTTIEEIVKYT